MGNCFSALQPTKRKKPPGGKKRPTGSEGGSARQPAPHGARSPEEGHHQRTPKKSSGGTGARGHKHSPKKSGGQPERSGRHSENRRRGREGRARTPREPPRPMGAQEDVPLRFLEAPQTDQRRDGRSPPGVPSVTPVPETEQA
ncbi:hypothetical protein DL764_000115 [Monosporascus ibericus]|uniref:Uncharacterized protein n=1 Tax=Monosporascus ibericus TaxID=155417 RepID=A0A4Q4TY83_9PEZI|nr:hypothetical protein DL764_000115 [Monosporascus ibericus]